jgi:PilZ domain-containing protein
MSVSETTIPIRHVAALREERRPSPKQHDLARVLRCRVLPAAGGPSLGGTLVKLSAQGAELLLRWWLGPGSAVSLRFSRGIFLAPFTVPARVTSCAEAGGGRWLLGCELSRPLTSDEMSALLS